MGGGQAVVLNDEEKTIGTCKFRGRLRIILLLFIIIKGVSAQGEVHFPYGPVFGKSNPKRAQGNNGRITHGKPTHISELVASRATRRMAGPGVCIDTMRSAHFTLHHKAKPPKGGSTRCRLSAHLSWRAGG